MLSRAYGATDVRTTFQKHGTKRTEKWNKDKMFIILNVFEWSASVFFFFTCFEC